MAEANIIPWNNLSIYITPPSNLKNNLKLNKFKLVNIKGLNQYTKLISQIVKTHQYSLPSN